MLTDEGGNDQITPVKFGQANKCAFVTCVPCWQQRGSGWGMSVIRNCLKKSNYLLKSVYISYTIGCPLGALASGLSYVHVDKHGTCAFFFSLVDEGREDPNAIISGPSLARQQNSISLVGRWWPNIECWLGSFVVLQGIRTSVAKKPYIFCDFSGGGGGVQTPPPPPLDSHMWYNYFTPPTYTSV